MSTALVEMFNNQPMTTSLAIADGVGIQHKNVIAIARKYVNDLQQLGRVAFETRPFETNGGIQYQEIALFNEGQAMFFLTLQKNTEKVVQFKLALVKAFLELRDRLTQTTPHTNNPLTLSHRADIRVAADRTFRSVLRACRSAGARMPTALQRANEITLRETGVDMLSELRIDTTQNHGYAEYEGHLQFLDAWVKNELPVPCAPCRSQHLYMAYQHWQKLQGGFIQPTNKVLAAVVTHCGFVKRKLRYSRNDGLMCSFVFPHGNWFASNQTQEIAQYMAEFEAALNDWMQS